jgi:RNA polymerase sigma factor (sigma-70 family)
VDLFTKGFGRLFRYLDRLSGDAELAQDLAQEAYVRLYRRQSLPDAPEAWLISVAMNLLRNNYSIEKRRRELMSEVLADRSHSDPGLQPDAAAASQEIRRVVRQVLDRMPERERQLLLLSAEGYSYRDIALALELKEVSVGTLLARARLGFRELYRSGSDDG